MKAVPLAAAEFLIGNDMATLQAQPIAEAEALLWIAPGPPALLSELVRGGHLPRLKWCHCFYAGVDAIGGFVREDLAPAGIPLSNGRGAFSHSLAEYAMCAALHFVKQVPRCIENRREKKWDKFVMAELRGKTLGLLGSGDIAMATARLAKAFGMRVVALRRNARKPETSGCVDLVLGPYDGPILQAHKEALFSEADVVVCTLPGTAETKHFVSKAELAAMKPGAVFISLGRAPPSPARALPALPCPALPSLPASRRPRDQCASPRQAASPSTRLRSTRRCAAAGWAASRSTSSRRSRCRRTARCGTRRTGSGCCSRRTTPTTPTTTSSRAGACGRRTSRGSAWASRSRRRSTWPPAIEEVCFSCQYYRIRPASLNTAYVVPGWG